jgi:hypothetical protein
MDQEGAYFEYPVQMKPIDYRGGSHRNARLWNRCLKTYRQSVFSAEFRNYVHPCIPGQYRSPTRSLACFLPAIWFNESGAHYADRRASYGFAAQW